MIHSGLGSWAASLDCRTAPSLLENCLHANVAVNWKKRGVSARMGVGARSFISKNSNYLPTSDVFNCATWCPGSFGCLRLRLRSIRGGHALGKDSSLIIAAMVSWWCRIAWDLWRCYLWLLAVTAVINLVIRCRTSGSHLQDTATHVLLVLTNLVVTFLTRRCIILLTCKYTCWLLVLNLTSRSYNGILGESSWAYNRATHLRLRAL